jgi:hypothetical protein
MNDIYETLKKLSNQTKRKDPSFIYLDELDNQIKEIPLSKLDSSASAYINPAKLIHDFMFGN